MKRSRYKDVHKPIHRAVCLSCRCTRSRMESARARKEMLVTDRENTRARRKASKMRLPARRR